MFMYRKGPIQRPSSSARRGRQSQACADGSVRRVAVLVYGISAPWDDGARACSVVLSVNRTISRQDPLGDGVLYVLIEYASPWAGANLLPMSTSEHSRWERRTRPEMKRLAEQVPEAGIHFSEQGPRCPPATIRAAKFTSVCINTAVYLAWLVGQRLGNGVVFRRAVVTHIHEARSRSHTGEEASIVDNAVTPARGQMVLVRNELHPIFTTSGTDDGPTNMLYTMQRPAGRGTVLGGTYDVGRRESAPDPNTALRIHAARRGPCAPRVPTTTATAGLSVVRHAAGLRPYRPAGVRVESERLDDGTWVVRAQ
ncbi:hypothetical protein E4U42_000753 [Claviceps africana]|uniref:Uncharacterized protein n=1 Tax=Claviceps africana TaxID=83212 RepID=A0A8K0IZQ6_9HYPO|nr:hypothetical protein E4U42_000753 [Claviceps africana]